MKQQSSSRASATRGRSLLACCALLGLLASAVMVWHSSRAAFTATRTNPSNAWAAGSVSLTDDDSGAAQFAASGIAPGQQQTHCITVTYGGSLAAAVTLYATASSGTLRPYLNLTVESGSGGNFGSCTGFTSESIDYVGTLADFASTRTDYASGASVFTPTGAGQSRSYRFTTMVDSAAPNSTQGGTATATLQWEARSNTAVNVALGKSASQVSTYDAVNGIPSHAVDGNIDGNFGGHSIAETDNTTEAWWQVDLGSNYGVDRIEIWNRTDCCTTRTADYYVFVSDTPFASGSLAATRSQANMWSSYQSAAAGYPTTISVDHRGRYVRVQLAGTNLLTLAEVKVFA